MQNSIIGPNIMAAVVDHVIDLEVQGTLALLGGNLDVEIAEFQQQMNKIQAIAQQAFALVPTIQLVPFNLNLGDMQLNLEELTTTHKDVQRKATP